MAGDKEGRRPAMRRETRRADGRLRGGPPPGGITVAASSPDSVCVCIRRNGREGKCAGDGKEGIRLERWVPPQFGKNYFGIYEKFVNNLKYIYLVSAIHKNNLKVFLKNLAYICIISKLHHRVQ